MVKPAIGIKPTGWKPTSGSKSGSLAKKQELYPTEVKGESWYNFPSSLAQTVKTYNVGKAIDPETGKEVVINEAIAVEPIGFNGKGMIIGEVGNGQLKRGNEPLFATDDKTSEAPLSDKIKRGRTESDLKTRAFDLLSAKADKPKSSIWSNVENVKLEKDESGNYKLKGTVTAYEGYLGKNVKPGEKLKDRYTKVDSKEVEIPITPITDKSAKRRLLFPLKDYRNLVSGQEKSYKIGDKTVGEYLDEVQNGSIQTQEQIPTFSKEELTGQGYSDEQIDNAVKSGKIKLQ